MLAPWVASSFRHTTSQALSMSSPIASKALAAGDVAPDFTADSTSGQQVTLSSFQGKKRVLLAFFPLAFTSTCTTELCDFSADFDQFSAKDVEVMPISVDSVPTLKEFKLKHQMRVDLVSDFKRDIRARTVCCSPTSSFRRARTFSWGSTAPSSGRTSKRIRDSSARTPRYSSRSRQCRPDRAARAS